MAHPAADDCHTLPKPPSLPMLLRVLVATGCIALSIGGMVAALFGLAMVKGLAAGVVLLVWLAAMGALARMASAWVRQVQLGRDYSRRAFMLGVASLLALPLVLLYESTQADALLARLPLAAGVLVFEMVAASPAIVLAWHLNRFHARSREH